jgi:hypothetical protein
MGVKAIKKHYNIGHIVHKVGDIVYIGSPMVHDLIGISAEGVIIKPYDDLWDRKGELMRYQDEINSDSNLFVNLLNSADEFTESTTVYTWDGSQIVEDKAEKLGFPNTTHSGILQYDDSHYTNKREAIEKAAKNALSSAEFYNDRINVLKKDIEALESKVDKSNVDAKMLTKMMAEIDLENMKKSG